MATVLNGAIMRAGDTLTENVVGVRVSPDGRRKIEREGTGWRLYADAGPVPVRLDGLLAVYPSTSPLFAASPIDPHEFEEGRWIGFPDANGLIPISAIPVTPGDAYYRQRRVIAEHANKFIVEHSLENLRFTSEDDLRISLPRPHASSQMQRKAGNTDEFVRGTIGWLWRRIEAFRKMPFGTAAHDAAWRARRDEIDADMDKFCALCEGSGLAHRIVRKHPDMDWEDYQLAGLRFVSDRDFNATVGSRSMVTRAAHQGDVKNFINALDFFSEGIVDDDFSADLFKARSRVFSLPATPVMPDFSARTQPFWRAHMAAKYRTFYDRFKRLNRSQITDYEAAAVRNWCAMNLLVALDDRNVGDGRVRDVVSGNAEFDFRSFSGYLNTNFGPIDIRGATFGTDRLLFLRTRSMIEWTGRAMRDGPSVHVTDGTATNGLTRAWTSTAERDARIALFDSILGDATPTT